MNNLLMGLTTAAIIFMIHFAVVDFRFRVAGGLMGIWRQSPAPPGLWVVRLTLLPPMLAALAIAIFGPSNPLWFAVAILLLIHLAALLFLKAFPLE